MKRLYANGFNHLSMEMNVIKYQLNAVAPLYHKQQLTEAMTNPNNFNYLLCGFPQGVTWAPGEVQCLTN